MASSCAPGTTLLIRTEPSTTMYSASPGSPSRNRTAPLA